MLATALAQAGHEVRQAKDGATALTLARERAPQAVLLDIGLPDMDGYEVARRLRAQEETRNALLIAVTGYGQDSDRSRASQAGFDYHVVKPADVSALERLLSGAGRTA